MKYLTSILLLISTSLSFASDDNLIYLFCQGEVWDRELNQNDSFDVEHDFVIDKEKQTISQIITGSSEEVNIFHYEETPTQYIATHEMVAMGARPPMTLNINKHTLEYSISGLMFGIRVNGKCSIVEKKI